MIGEKKKMMPERQENPNHLEKLFSLFSEFFFLFYSLFSFRCLLKTPCPIGQRARPPNFGEAKKSSKENKRSEIKKTRRRSGKIDQKFGVKVGKKKGAKVNFFYFSPRSPALPLPPSLSLLLALPLCSPSPSLLLSSNPLPLSPSLSRNLPTRWRRRRSR